MNKKPLTAATIRRLAIAATVFCILFAIMNILGEYTVLTVVELIFTAITTVMVWVCYVMAKKNEDEKNK